MTVDDGASFDSRQQMDGDENSEVTLRSLATSLLWWRTTISLVLPILQSAGEGAFSLLVGQRSVVELRQDGTLHRTSLRSILPGGTTQVEIIRTRMGEPLPDGYEEAKVLRVEWSGADLGTVGYRRGEPSKHWRFLSGNEYYLPQAGPGIGPTVIVDTTPWVLPEGYRAHHLGTLEASRLFSDDTVLVAPHTFSADQYFKTYADWVKNGRPADPPVEWAGQNSDWDPDARPEPLHYATPVPVTADFGVTGLVVSAQWEEPSDLEAARSLLEARYDLKIGIWDLASNPTLRTTLLDATPVLPAPPVATAVPTGASKRAESKVDAKMATRAAERDAWARIAPQLAPLKDAGWVELVDRGLYSYRLTLADSPPYEAGHERYRLVDLSLSVTKRHSAVSVFIAVYNQVDLGAYTRERRGGLEGIAAPETCNLDHQWPELWRATGGWGDGVDWTKRGYRLASLTPRWVDVFADLCRECHRVRRESGYPDE